MLAPGAALTRTASGQFELVVGKCWRHIHLVVLSHFSDPHPENGPQGRIWQINSLSDRPPARDHIVLQSTPAGFEVILNRRATSFDGSISVSMAVEGWSLAQVHTISAKVRDLRPDLLVDAQGHGATQADLDAASCGPLDKPPS